MKKSTYNERFGFPDPYQAANRTTKYRDKKRKRKQTTSKKYIIAKTVQFRAAPSFASRLIVNKMGTR